MLQRQYEGTDQLTNKSPGVPGAHLIELKEIKGWIHLEEKLTYATEAKEITNAQKQCFLNVWQIANSVLNKGYSVIPPLFNDSGVMYSVSKKTKSCLLKSSLRNLDDLGISSRTFSS